MSRTPIFVFIIFYKDYNVVLKQSVFSIKSFNRGKKQPESRNERSRLSQGKHYPNSDIVHKFLFISLCWAVLSCHPASVFPSDACVSAPLQTSYLPNCLLLSLPPLSPFLKCVYVCMFVYEYN